MHFEFYRQVHDLDEGSYIYNKSLNVKQNYNIKMSISKYFLIYKLFNAVILTSILTLTVNKILLASRHILWKLLFIFVIESFANMHSNILSINFHFIGFRVFMAIQIVSSIALNIRVIVDYYWVSTEIEHFYMCTGVYMIAFSICLYCKLSRLA